MDYKAHADQLLKEWQMVVAAKTKHDAVQLRLQKDRCEEWAVQLMTARMWGSSIELAEACHQFESRLKSLKEKIVIEVLTHGSV